MTFILIGVALLAEGFGDNYVRCRYALPSTPVTRFVQSKSESVKWLKFMKDDESIPGFDNKASCEPLNREKVWHLLTKSEGGTVSISNGNLTEDQCETLAHKLTFYEMCNGCMRLVHSSDIIRAECFR